MMAVVPNTRPISQENKIQLGKLPPRHTFFLNPYPDERFTRCPGCAEPTKIRKRPFLVHIEPQVLLLLNMSGRYCPDCDLIILHQDVVEDLLVRTCEHQHMEVVGNDYSIVGTVERAFWHKYKGTATFQTVIDNLRDFERTVIYESMRPRWMPAESE